MSSLLGRTATTRGVLLRMREQLDFVNRGRELLEMKRDQLASTINKQLEKLQEREPLEKSLLEVYEKLKAAYSAQGYSSVASQAMAVSGLEVKVRPFSVMGVVVPEIQVEKPAKIGYLPSLSTYEVAEKLSRLLDRLFEVAIAEAQIEILARELMMTNRKVNALNKVLIPEILKVIRYIEGKLEEEMLEEFFRGKRLKKMLEKSD